MSQKRIEELIIDETSDMSGVFGISFVLNPAFEEKFKYFNEDSGTLKENLFAKAGEEKYMLYSPAIIPNKKIVRYDERGEEYFVYFSKETIQTLAENFLKNHYQDSFTFEHSAYQNGATVVESWIIENKNKDKANAIGFDLPKGTWMMGVKINDIDLWNKIKDGTVKGLSIEAYMTSKMSEKSKVNNSKQEDPKQELISKVTELIENFEQKNK